MLPQFTGPCKDVGTRPQRARAAPSRPVPGCVIFHTDRHSLSRSPRGNDPLSDFSPVAATPGEWGVAEVHCVAVLRRAALKAGVGSPFPDGEAEALEAGGRRAELWRWPGLGGEGALGGPPGGGGAAGGGALSLRAGADGRAPPLRVPPSPRRRRWRRRPEPGAAAEPEPSGWRHHGVRGVAHRVPDPAARARAPATPCARAGRRARRTRALPGREWGAGRGCRRCGPGVGHSPAGSFPVSVDSLTVSLPSLILVFRSPRPCVSLQVCWGLCLGLWVSHDFSLALCFRVFPLSLSRLCVPSSASHSFSAYLSLFSVTAPAAPPTPNHPMCVSGRVGAVNSWSRERPRCPFLAAPGWTDQARGPGRGSSPPPPTPDLVLTPDPLRSHPRAVGSQSWSALPTHALCGLYIRPSPGRWPCSPYEHLPGAPWPGLGHSPAPLPHLSPLCTACPVPLASPLPEVPFGWERLFCPLPTVPSDSAPWPEPSQLEGT